MLQGYAARIAGAQDQHTLRRLQKEAARKLVWATQVLRPSQTAIGQRLWRTTPATSPACVPARRNSSRSFWRMPAPLGAGRCVQCKATAVHRLDAAHPARAGVRLGAVHRQGHRAGSWCSTTCPRRQSPPASGLAWYRIQPATFDAPPGRSLGCTRPSLTGTFSKSKGLIPSMQATLMPYWSGEERRWWRV